MNDYRFNQNVASHSSNTMQIATNTVLKNTYMLLAMTLAFSAISAYAAIFMNIGQINPWIFLAGAFGFQFLIHLTANSAFGIIATFLFSGFMGFTAGPILNYVISTGASHLVMIALGGTAMIFFGLSGYILTTQKDMSFLSGALVAGSVVALVAVLVSISFQIPALHLAVCVLFMLIASGMIMFQTSAIIHGGETNYIIATVTLYLSIYNIFMALLQLLLAFSDNR